MDAVWIALIVVGFALVVFLALVLRFPEETRLLLLRTESIRLNSEGLAVRFFREAIEEREHRVAPPGEIAPEISAIAAGRILWVDDAPANNRLEVQALRALGVEVDVVSSNREAGDYAAAASYDLVLSDIDRAASTTAESGLEVPGLLRSLDKEIPVAFYVGRADGGETPEGDPVFNKPSELLRFLAASLAKEPKGR